MQKYQTETVPFDDLKRGDRILVSYGCVTVYRVQTERDGRKTVIFEENQAPITQHPSNWPERVIAELPPEPVAKFRAVSYRQDGSRRVSSVYGSFETADHALEVVLGTPAAEMTGGHVEQFVPGIGWVVASEELQEEAS